MRDALDHLPMETRVVFFAYLSPWFNHVLWKRKTSDCILELFISVTKSLSRLFTPTLLTSILVTLRFFFNNRPSFEATPIHPANILSEKVLVENYKTILSKILRKIQRSVEYCSTAFSPPSTHYLLLQPRTACLLSVRLIQQLLHQVVSRQLLKLQWSRTFSKRCLTKGPLPGFIFLARFWKCCQYPAFGTLWKVPVWISTCPKQ